jgi:hypothetical protein
MSHARWRALRGRLWIDRGMQLRAVESPYKTVR